MSGTARWLVAALVLIGLAFAGCDSKNDRDAAKRRERLARRERRDRERDADRAADRRGPDQVIGRGDRSPDRSARGLDEIPRTATRVDEGDSTRLAYSPTRNGTLYLYDVDNDHVVFSSPVREGERFVLDPAANRATVDGRTVLGTGLDPRHRYRLYFDRSPGA